MQDKPQLTSKTSLSPNKTNSVLQYSRHHVLQGNYHRSNGQGPASSKCPLMSIPDESLTHITSLVADPPTLLALSLVNRRLRNHIADDNTWYRAFAFHFLGVGPEVEPDDEDKLMLRRSESTWAKEYVMRFNLTRRWERSRSGTLSYQPHYWEVSSMHLLENVSLFTANLQYGVVARSFPLTGRTLKGYLDASGATNGHANPNENFSLNVSCTSLSSCGGTGRIAWGYRNGEVAVTSAPRVMESNRSTARYNRCRLQDKHPGEVRCMTFAGRNDELFVTGCAHGLVKLWETKRMQCLWTGLGTRVSSLVPTACVKIAFNVGSGVLVAALEGGDMMVWWGFNIQSVGPLVDTVQELRIVDESSSSKSHTVDTLLLDPNSSPSQAIILVHHADDRHIIRLIIDLISATIHRTILADGPLGPITAIKACFSVQSQSSSDSAPAPLTPDEGPVSSLAISLVTNKLGPRESSFVLAGDSLGRVSVWNWDAEGSYAPFKDDGKATERLQVNSSRRWDAHDDGAICAIDFNDAVIVTGSTRGTLKVWDSLTLTLLRPFSSPVSKPSATGDWDPVGQVTVRGSLLVASIGSRILVWQAGVLTSGKKRDRKSATKAKGRTTKSVFNKWQQQIELHKDIRESQMLLDDERAHSQRVYGRERAQLSTLDQLGLDEREAVEYLLMLSQEEEEQRRVAELASGISPSGESDLLPTRSEDVEGVFSLDEPTGLVSSLPLSQDSKPSLMRAPGPNLHSAARSLPRCIPSSSNFKVQVSPPFFPESAEAGLSASPLHLATLPAGSSSPIHMDARSSSRVSPPMSSLSSPTDTEDFPAMGSSTSTQSGSASSSVRLAGSWTRGSPSSSFVGTNGSGWPSSLSSSSTSRSSSLSVQGGDGKQLSQAEEEDEELRFVLELSLAEARSRHEA